MSDLALLGGRPVRRKPFQSPVVIGKDERRYAARTLARKELSRFMGSPTKDIGRLLTMPSAEAERYAGQYFTFLGGRMVRKFEADFAKKFKVPYAVSVNSATSGLASALGACGIGPGDEVITTCLSFNATALSILAFNAIPVFVDIEEETCCMDPGRVKEAITPRTKAILPVHLLGNACAMDEIVSLARHRNIRIIEDCAQAPGTKYKGRYVGTIGDAGIFSFQETKNITTGEGGMVITKDPAMAKRVRLIRNHGESIPDGSWDDRELENIIGMNYRMTELTAAIGIAQLKRLDRNNRLRKNNASYLSRHLKGLQGLSPAALRHGSVPHLFPMIYDPRQTGVERYKVLAALKAEGVPAGAGYLRLMYENPMFLRKVAYGKGHCPWSCHLYGRSRTYKNGDCPLAERLLRENLIWFYHINAPNRMSDMKDVVTAFRKVFANMALLKAAKMKPEAGYKW